MTTRARGCRDRRRRWEWTTGGGGTGSERNGRLIAGMNPRGVAGAEARHGKRAHDKGSSGGRGGGGGGGGGGGRKK